MKKRASNVKSTVVIHIPPTCYLCGTKGAVFFEGVVDHLYGVPGSWNIIKCQNDECGLFWVDQMPEIEDIPKLYSKYYTHAANKSLLNYWVNLYEHLREGILASSYGYRKATNSMCWLVLGRILACIPLMRERIGGTVMWLEASQRGRLLDVGCGDGKLLQRLHKLGWNVVGVEPDNDAAELVRTSFGLDIHGCSLEEAKFPDASFDVITMHHVIEHLPNPLRTLRECGRVLRENGHLVLVTPNTMSSGSKHYGQDWYHLDTPRHLYLFTPKGIERAIRDACFRIESIKTIVSRGAHVWKNSDSIRHMRLNKGRLNKGIIRQRVSKYFTVKI